MRTQISHEIPRQPLHWSLRQQRPAWGSAPLWYCCVLGWSLSKCKFTSTALSCQAPNQLLWILHLQGRASGHVFFLPHQTFPFFRPSHFLLLSNLLKLFISLSPLCCSPCPDAAYTCFVVLQRKTTQDKRAIKLWDLLSVLLTKLWTHQASEDNEALWIWYLGNLGENSPFMEAFDFIWGSLLGSQLLLFHSQQLLPLTSSSDFPVSPMLFACWGQDLFVLTPVGQVCFLPGHMPVLTEFFNPLS